MTDPVLERVGQYHDELTAIRRDIHAHPELGFEETRTAALVAGKLREWGIEVTEGVGKTGVVGVLKGKRAGQGALGLRADMDCLAIHEQNKFGHVSTYEGKMHGCGHDGHTTMLLGAARYLAENPDFAGTVNFIFQPAEEGRGGAKAMLADGLFERFPCDAVYGMHNMPGIPVGKFTLREGPMMATSGRFRVTFKGTGGHGGATPHLANDLTTAMAHFVLGLQTIVGRDIAATETAVISIGHISGGQMDSLNVMPAELFVGGTMRCFNEETRDRIEERVGTLARTFAASVGAKVDVDVRWGAAALRNHGAQTRVAAAAASEVVGPEQVDAHMVPSTGGEDFSHMLMAKPGAFVFIGNGVNPHGTTHAVHTPLYDFNDEIIPLGVAYWVKLVEQELGLEQHAAA